MIACRTAVNHALLADEDYAQKVDVPWGIHSSYKWRSSPLRRSSLEGTSPDRRPQEKTGIARGKTPFTMPG